MSDDRTANPQAAATRIAVAGSRTDRITSARTRSEDIAVTALQSNGITTTGAAALDVEGPGADDLDRAIDLRVKEDLVRFGHVDNGGTFGNPDLRATDDLDAVNRRRRLPRLNGQRGH